MFEQENEIKFFEETVGETYMMNGHPHNDNDHPEKIKSSIQPNPFRTFWF